MIDKLLPAGKSGNTAKTIVYLALAALGIYLIIMMGSRIWGGIDGVLEFLGLKETEEEKKTREALEGNVDASNDPTSPFSPQFYKTAPAGSALKNGAATDAAAEQIWNSVGVVYDNPEAGLSAFKIMPSQAAVSFLADRFQSKYGRDLIGWLIIKYDTDKQKKFLNQIFAYVAKLPKYK